MGGARAEGWGTASGIHPTNAAPIGLASSVYGTAGTQGVTGPGVEGSPGQQASQDRQCR